MKTYDKSYKNKLKRLIGTSILAPMLCTFFVRVSVADNTNVPPANNSQKALPVVPQKSEIAEPSVNQPNESTSDTAKSYPEETAFSISGEGLTEKPSAVEGGGIQLDLEGRFRSPRTAIIEPDGKVKVGHEPYDKITGKKNGHNPHDQNK